MTAMTGRISTNQMAGITFSSQTMGISLLEATKEGNIREVTTLLNADESSYALSEDALGGSLREACQRGHYEIAEAILNYRKPEKIAAYDLGQALKILAHQDEAFPTIQKITQAPRFPYVMPDTLQAIFGIASRSLSLANTSYFLNNPVFKKALKQDVDLIKAIYISVDRACKELFQELLVATFPNHPNEEEKVALKKIFLRLVELQNFDLLSIFTTLHDDIVQTAIPDAVCIGLEKNKPLSLQLYSSPQIFSELSDKDLGRIASVAARCVVRLRKKDPSILRLDPLPSSDDAIQIEHMISASSAALQTFLHVLRSSNFKHLFESDELFVQFQPEASSELLDIAIKPFDEQGNRILDQEEANQILGIFCIAMAEDGVLMIPSTQLYRLTPSDFFRAIRKGISQNHTEVANTMIYSASFQGLPAVGELQRVTADVSSEGLILDIAGLLFKDVPIILNLFRDLKRGIDAKQAEEVLRTMNAPIFQSVTCLQEVKPQVELALQERRFKDAAILIAGQFFLELPILSKSWVPIKKYLTTQEFPPVQTLQNISTLRPEDEEFGIGIDFNTLNQKGPIVVEQIRKRILPEEDQKKIHEAIAQGTFIEIAAVVISHIMSEMLIPREVRDQIGRLGAGGDWEGAHSLITTLPLQGISQIDYEEILSLACEQEEENIRIIKALINPSKETRRVFPRFETVQQNIIWHCFQKICENGKVEAFKMFFNTGKFYQLPTELVRRGFSLLVQDRNHMALLHEFIGSQLMRQIQSEDIAQLFKEIIQAKSRKESALDVILVNPTCMTKVEPADLGIILHAISESNSLMGAFILGPFFAKVDPTAVYNIFFAPLITLGKPLESPNEIGETKAQFEDFKKMALSTAAQHVYKDIPKRNPDYLNQFFHQERELDYLLIAAAGLGLFELVDLILNTRGQEVSHQAVKFAAFQTGIGTFTYRFVRIGKNFESHSHRIYTDEFPKEDEKYPLRSPIRNGKKNHSKSREELLQENKLQILDKLLTRFPKFVIPNLSSILIRASLHRFKEVVNWLIHSRYWSQVSDTDLRAARDRAADHDIKEILNTQIDKRMPLSAKKFGGL